MRPLKTTIQNLFLSRSNRRSIAIRRQSHNTCGALERLEDRALLAVVSHWTADNTAADAVGTNHGTLIDGATFASGQVGQAFRFDGVNDRVGIPDSNSLKLTHSLSIEGWIRVDAFPSVDHGEILFRGDDRGGLDPYSLAVEPSGNLRFQITSSTNTTAQVEARILLGEFIHVAATLNGVTGAMSVYENGVLMAQVTTAIRPFADLDPASNPGVGIGNHGGYPGTPHNFPFNGRIDELKLYDQALTSDEVLAVYNASRGSQKPTLSINDVATTEGDLRFGTNLGALVPKNANGGLDRSSGMTYGPDGNITDVVVGALAIAIVPVAAADS